MGTHHHIRCVPADLVYDKYAVEVNVGDVYQPVDNWWLLITAESTNALVRPYDLKTCLENLRTLTEFRSSVELPGFRFLSRKVQIPRVDRVNRPNILGTIMHTGIGPRNP